MARRAIWVALLLGAVYFALQAGEYSTRDILRQRSRRRHLLARVDSLTREVDSLRRAERMIRTDSEMQERIAREEFGLVRGKNEIIYKFATPARTDSDRVGAP